MAARRRNTSPDRLQLLNSTTVRMPLTGREVTTGKLLREGEEVFSVAWNRS